MSESPWGWAKSKFQLQGLEVQIGMPGTTLERERDPGRETSGGHLLQCPHCNPLCMPRDEKLCSVTSDCPFQILRTKQYESAMFPGTQEKTSPRQWQNAGQGLRKSIYSLVQPRQDQSEKTEVTKSFESKWFQWGIHFVYIFLNLCFYSFFVPHHPLHSNIFPLIFRSQMERFLFLGLI